MTETDAGAAFLADVGLRIRLVRTARGLSQERLAELATVSRVTLGSVERGEHASDLLTYRAVAAALDVPLGLLMDDGTDPDLLLLALSRRR